MIDIDTNQTLDPTELDEVVGGYAVAWPDPFEIPTCPGPTFPNPPTDPWS